MMTELFDAKADIYEKIRPGYPKDLYGAIFGYAGLEPGSAILEIGIGAGNATLPFLAAGHEVTAIEPGKNLATICGKKFAQYPEFSLSNEKFETYRSGGKFFDLAFSATAFHWIPENVGYTKVYSLLKPGGTFARFANHPFPAKDNHPLRARLRDIYRKYYDPYHPDRKFSEFDAREAAAVAKLARKYRFVDIRHAIFNRTRILSRHEYIMLLNTYSDHLALPEAIRSQLCMEIEKAIEAHGGKITIADTIDLELARKPQK